MMKSLEQWNPEGTKYRIFNYQNQSSCWCNAHVMAFLMIFSKQMLSFLFIFLLELYSNYAAGYCGCVLISLQLVLLIRTCKTKTIRRNFTARPTNRKRGTGNLGSPPPCRSWTPTTDFCSGLADLSSTAGTLPLVPCSWAFILFVSVVILSRNSWKHWMDSWITFEQVVMAVAQLYHHCAPKSEVSTVAKALIRLLRGHKWVQYFLIAHRSLMW